MKYLPLILAIAVGCSSSDDEPENGSTNNASTNNATSNSNGDSNNDTSNEPEPEQCSRPCGARQKCYFEDACLDIPPSGACFDDTDCDPGEQCMGATYCPPDVVCIVGTMAGECLSE